MPASHRESGSFQALHFQVATTILPKGLEKRLTSRLKRKIKGIEKEKREREARGAERASQEGVDPPDHPFTSPSPIHSRQICLVPSLFQTSHSFICLIHLPCPLCLISGHTHTHTHTHTNTHTHTLTHKHTHTHTWEGCTSQRSSIWLTAKIATHTLTLCTQIHT